MKLWRALVLVGFGIVASGVPTACSGGVVGGECRRGLSQCGSICVDLSGDDAHCGACETTCGAGTHCAAGTCTAGEAGPDGSAGSSGAGGNGGHDAGNGGNAGLDGAAATGGTSGRGGSGGSGARDASIDGSSGGAGATEGGVSTEGGIPTCPAPYDTAQHCGSCDNHCTGATPLCEGIESDYQCVELCAPPLVACNGQCVNTDNDANNCGRCNHRCPSGICQGGQCVGATAGHVVDFCGNYATKPAAGAPAEVLLGNSVFLGTKNPVRVYGYTEFTPAAVVTSVGRTLDSAATARSRSYTQTVVTDATQVPLNLSIFDYEVLLVYDQPNAPAGALASTGTSWASALDSFTRAGGIVIALASDQGQGEMPDLLTNANLLAVSGQTNVTDDAVYNRSPADAVGLNVLSTFKALSQSCTFTTTPPSDSTTVFVVTDTASSAGSLGAPMVVHRVVTPP